MPELSGLPASHPSTYLSPKNGGPKDRGPKDTSPRAGKTRLTIPCDGDRTELQIDGKAVSLTNCSKLFWTEPRITKGELLQYYADLAPVLIPHLENRAMVMKRYPNGAAGGFFFQKRTPEPHPDWLPICEILHASGNLVPFPVISDVAGLLWLVNLGCIDLNPWYARCDDVDRPDYMHFDLDPTPGADFETVREAALLVHRALDHLKMRNYVKTSGSRGVHIYVPIVRGPDQKTVWAVAKALAQELAAREPAILTSEYRVAKRPKDRVLIDYNQNAWGRTLASVYSVRPVLHATVSTPVTWEELENGVRIEDFKIDNVPARVHKLGDLFRPLLASRGRFRIESR